MNICITDKVSWDSLPCDSFELDIKDQTFGGVKSYKGGYLMYDNNPEGYLGYVPLKKQLLKIDPNLNISNEPNRTVL